MATQTQPGPKTLIGILASHDDIGRNNDLARLFEALWRENSRRLKEFHFIFTGGTFRRIVLREDTQTPQRTELKPIRRNSGLSEFLKHNSTILPERQQGGVAILANLIVQRQCSILWPFLSPTTTHWLNPENLALMRLCDIWNVKRLVNAGSVETWFRYEAERDVTRNPQEIPVRLLFGVRGFPTGKKERVNGRWFNQWWSKEDLDLLKLQDQKPPDVVEGDFKPTSESEPDPEFPSPSYFPRTEPKDRAAEFWKEFQDQTIALIAHDEMKEQMVNFAIEYERELSAFGRILATGTTGRLVEEAARRLGGRIKRCRSGPYGGDIEIATEILYGRCDVVIFLIDPLHPHPHIEDIRVIFAAAMIEQEVRMLTNEVQAREWMDVVVRPNVV